MISLILLASTCILSDGLILTIQQIGVSFLLVLLLIVLAIGAIRHWASNNFYLTRTQMFFVCFLAFLLALAAFLVGWFEGEDEICYPKYFTWDFSFEVCLNYMATHPLLLLTLPFSTLFRKTVCWSICWLFFSIVSSCWEGIDCELMQNIINEVLNFDTNICFLILYLFCILLILH